ncbi:phage/plasmid primase, P4 family [Enterococcus dispar]|uniref:DNA primase family protein n=1 Tax=Enterococcus dispar TaxID=44009 RepID=UPI00232CFF4B|nr:phage/plasmid primase, P4 family [Enterococcus dispar]WCG32798.1 phage/plasmid primase, P4 family [Enterococcus dispar]
MTISESVLKDVVAIRHTVQKKKKNSYFGKTPLNLRSAIKEIEGKSVDIAQSMVDELNGISPDWFRCVVEVNQSDPNKFSISHYFDHENMGNMIIKENHLLRFPKLLEGAVYEPLKGAWRYFGKNELISFTEKLCLEELQAWGYYDQRYISPVKNYVKQKTYDPSYSNRSPFEESNPALIPFKNGTYNILADEMKPHDPDNFILISYNYKLDMSGTPTPATDKFFHDFFGDAALFMKQFIGYTFYRSHAPAQDLVFLYGKGGEGKSSFLNMMAEYYITKENRTALTPQMLTTDKFAVVELLGKALNVSGDIDKDYISQTGILKQLTGGDAVRGEFKGIQGFTFVSHSKHIFSMNEFFHFKDMSPGFADRLTVVPITIGNQRLEGAKFWDSQDLDEIEKESASFVYQCIQEFKKIFNGKKANFTRSKAMADTKAEWLFDNDRIAQFLFECCEVDSAETRGEIAKTVAAEYRAFCSCNGYKAQSTQELTKYLKDKCKVPKSRNTKGFNDSGQHTPRYIGLKLISTYRILSD